MKIKRRNRIIVLLLTIIMIFNITALYCFAYGGGDYYGIKFNRLYENINATDGTNVINFKNINEIYIEQYDTYIDTSQYDYISLLFFMTWNDYTITLVDSEWNNLVYTTLTENLSIKITDFKENVQFMKSDYGPEYINDTELSGYQEVYLDEVYDLMYYNDENYDELMIKLTSGVEKSLYVNIGFSQDPTIETTAEESTASTSESASDVSGSPIPTEILNIDQATMTFMNNTTGIYITLGCILLLVACAIVMTFIRRE